MFGETTISYIYIIYLKIWNHPIETTIYKWLALGFPGMMVSLCFVFQAALQYFWFAKILRGASGMLRVKSAKVGRADGSANCLPAECWELGEWALPSMKLRARPWKSMVGRCFCLGGKDLFWHAMLALGTAKVQAFFPAWTQQGTLR